jgi:hypothetical protein
LARSVICQIPQDLTENNQGQNKTHFQQYASIFLLDFEVHFGCPSSKRDTPRGMCCSQSFSDLLNIAFDLGRIQNK